MAIEPSEVSAGSTAPSESTDEGGGYRKNWNPYQHYKDVEIAELYDSTRFSSLSGRVFSNLEKRSVRKAFEGIPANSLILDAPCGTGRLAEVLLELGHRVVGVDISPAMLEVARRRLVRFEERFQARVVDVRELENLDEKYDAALCARVLMHFPLEEQVEFLGSIVRVTTGPVVFNQSVDSPYNRLRRGLKKVMRNRSPAAYPNTMREISALIDGAGLKLERRWWLLPGLSEAAFFVCR